MIRSKHTYEDLEMQVNLASEIRGKQDKHGAVHGDIVSFKSLAKHSRFDFC